MHGASFTPFQAQVARAFFGLPEARSFLLAGGLALTARHEHDLRRMPHPIRAHLTRIHRRARALHSGTAEAVSPPAGSRPVHSHTSVPPDMTLGDIR